MHLRENGANIAYDRLSLGREIVMHCLRSFFAAALASAALLVSASAQAAPLFDFSSESNNDVPVEVTLGYTFEVTPGGVSVDGIGIFDFGSDGLASAHEVALWDINENLIIAPRILNPGLPPSNSDMSASGLGSYIYVNIDSILLGPGEYVLGVSYLPAGGNKDVAVNMPDLPILQNAANVIFGGGVFGEAVGVNVMFPGFSGGANNYFGPALRISATIPEPLTLMLLIMGMAGLGCSRRKASLPVGAIPA
jgi:hypothetical protein